MFEVKKISIFTGNIALLALSWVFHKFPQGDEYMVLFVIPVIFVVAPYILSKRTIVGLLAANLVFFLFYAAAGILNTIDVIILMFLLAGASILSSMIKNLDGSFEEHYTANISREERKYNDIFKDLESVEREGRVVERELARISRLYEITKQLGSVLKFDALLDKLFDFLQDNFQFEAAHLLVFSNGEFAKGVSKGVSNKYDKEGQFDYMGLYEYMKERDLKDFFIEKHTYKEFFNKLNVKSDTFLAFPLFVKDLSAILAIEGATKIGYSRFGIVVPQIALELRKVELYEQVEKLSILDGLTGVYLRRYLMERLEEEVDRARRLNLTFSLGMIDIDHFKQCNDQYGHLVGDAVLKEVASRLKFSVREVDMIARYGGEEFCILLPETTKDFAVSVAERLRRHVESKKIKAFDEEMNITVSAGIATYPENGQDVESLIEMADTALYKAKRKGRNRVCVV